MRPTQWLGNRLLTLTANILFRSTLSDMETCYKLFDRAVLDGITIESDGFDFEPEITAKVLRRGHRIYEVPVSYTGRDDAEAPVDALRTDTAVRLVLSAAARVAAGPRLAEQMLPAVGAEDP